MSPNARPTRSENSDDLDLIADFSHRYLGNDTPAQFPTHTTTMEQFTPFLSTIGGLLIGLAAAMMLVFNGRIAGISGIFDGTVLPDEQSVSWKTLFTLGLLTGGLAAFLIAPSLFAVGIERSTLTFVVAGLLVGFGTRLGNGCTSGHGVCGMARFSRRSIVATASFMLAGGLTVYLVQHVIGGAL
jgi:uncharacterized membrane protein YedE/YeeE